VLSAVTVVVLACSPATEEASHVRSPSDTAAEAGAIVTLALAHPSVESGQWVRARITAENRGTVPIRWWGGTCRLDGVIRVDALQPIQGASGRAWPGDAGVLKDIVLLGAHDVAPPRATEPDVDGADTRCRIDRGRNELRPGDIAAGEVRWQATTRLGAPLPPGTYVMRGAFPRVAEGVVDDPALMTLELDLDPIEVSIELEVTGAGAPLLGAGLAMDALLADARLASLLVGSRPAAWRLATLRFAENTWVLRVPIAPGRIAHAVADAGTGVVLEVQLSR
jgi:hypothetical protein